MEIKFIRNLTLFLSAAALSAGLVSCQKDSGETGVQGALGNGAISFGMAFETPSQDLTTKGSFELTDDEGNVVLMMGEEVFDTPAPEQTKATLINDVKNFYKSFRVCGYSGKSIFEGIDTLTVRRQDTTYPDGKYEQWFFRDGIVKSWPDGTNLEFFAWAPADAWTTVPTFTTVAEGTPAASFDYTVVNALTQKDILLARYFGNGTDNTLGASSAVDGVATMKFSHALSSIKFKAAEGLTGFTINSIKLEGIVKTAACTVSFESDTTTYEWTNPTDTTHYMKTFNPAIAPSALESGLEHFIVIPQTFGEGSKARIVLNITCGGVTYNVSYKLYDNTRPAGKQTTTWEAGKTTVYIINYSGSLEVSVEDTVDGIVKKDLAITSTENSTVKCYIRALIIGNWHQNLGTSSEPIPGTIMAPWSLTDGTFSPALPATAGTAVNNWILGADGFYYYKYPVYPDTETGTGADGEGDADKLFTSYTAPVDAPVNGSYLNLSIVVQGVKWDMDKVLVRKAWGSTAAGYLSATDKESNSVSE